MARDLGLLLIVCAACGSSGSASHADRDAATAGRDGRATTEPDGSRAPTGDGSFVADARATREAGRLDASGGPDAETKVTPGNGCAAGLGIDAGFYTCSREYFVAPGGSDSNTGTSWAQALKTLGAATRLSLEGGDCVTVADGTYNETVVITTSGSADTCSGYVVFRAATQGGAKIVSTDEYTGVSVDASYVMVDGFDMTDPSTGSAFGAGTNTLMGGKVIVYHHIAAIRNIAHDSGGAGLGAIHADYIRFEGNTVYGNSSRSPYGDSGIDLWEAQASDALPGFHIVIRNNYSYMNVESDIAANLQTDGEGIIVDSFDYADATYGTTPYAAETLIENNVIWGNGGRGIEAAGAQPTSHVTIRNNTVFNDNTQLQQYAGAEIVSWGNGNSVSNNIVILGPSAQNGENSDQTMPIADRCGPSSGGVQVTGGSVWSNNIVFSMKSGVPLSSTNCVTTPSSYTTIPPGSNLMGTDPRLSAENTPAMPALSSLTISSGNPAARAGTASSFAPFDYAYLERPSPPSIGAFEP